MRRKAEIPPGRLIVVEGADGTGKSTLAAAMAKRFETAGSRTVVTSFPDRAPGSLGAHVYELHHEPHRFGINTMSAASKQLLHIAAHIDVITTKIQAWLEDGTTVVLDRYWWSTWVYGTLDGVSADLLDAMIAVESEAWGRTKPTLAVLLRRQEPIGRDVNLTEWGRLQTQYSNLSVRERAQFPVLVIDDSPSPAAACDAIEDALATQPPDPTATPQQGALLDLATPALRDNTPLVLTHLSPLKATAAYNTYWTFAAERQEIFFRRFEGRPAPWTNDPILQAFKFTNAYRASDRVSQFLIRNVIYNDLYPNDPEEVFFRILLFKLFNRIDTWELLEQNAGPLLYSEYSFHRYDHVLTTAMANGQRIYSGAYIMPSGSRVLGSETKHRNHLSLLERMIDDEAPRKIQGSKTMHEGFDILVSYPTIGEFLGYQFIIDLNYSDLTSFSEHDFVIPGPGALDGIRKCFIDLGGLNEPELIRLIADRQDQEFERLGLRFRSLWGRSLHLIDCQNLFCEVDKYSRVRHPEIAGISGRTRIKQRFSQNPTPIDYWFPPKWGLNDRIVTSVGERDALAKGAI